MGVQGLTGLLEKNIRPQVISHRQGADKNNATVLLVDASAVQFVLLDRLSPSGDWKSQASFAEKLYRLTCSFYHGIQKCGLRCVLICDGPCRYRAEKGGHAHGENTGMMLRGG